MVEYLAGSRWIAVTGPQGVMTRAIIRAYSLNKQTITVLQASNLANQSLRDPYTKSLLSPWKKNDFGRWAWNLKQNGHRTAYYIHTTPQDELNSERAQPVMLTQSHGCIHIRPADRDVMMRRGFLKSGIEVDIKPYGQVGPPK